MKKLFTFLLIASTLSTYAQVFDSIPPYFQVGNLVFENIFYNESNFFLNGAAIDDATIFSTGQNDAYDGAFEIAIGDSAFTNLEIGSDTTFSAPVTISSAIQIINGMNVTKQFMFMENMPIVRLLIKIENPTSTDVTSFVKIGSNVGSDDYTILDSCSTGDTILSSDDRWVITSDGYSDTIPDYGWDPINTFVRFGGESPLNKPIIIDTLAFVDLNGNSFDNLEDSIPVTIPANSSIYVIQFNRLDSTVIAAKQNVSLFDNVDSMISVGLFAGIAEIDYSKIVNWDMPSPFSLKQPVESNVIIMPNPVKEFAQINYAQLPNVSEIRVVNILGQVVKTVNVDENSTSIILNASGLESGLYFLQFIGGSSQIYVKKMLKQ